MNEENKTIQLDTAGTEDRLKEALPVLSAPESLSAENVARALSGVKKVRRIPMSKYVGAAVAAVLVLVIGIGAVSGGLLNRKKEMAPDMVMPGDTVKEPGGYYEYNADPEPAGEPGDDFEDRDACSPYKSFNYDPDSGQIVVEGEYKLYAGKLDDAVPFNDTNAKRYLGLTSIETASFPGGFVVTMPESWGGNGGGHDLPAPDDVFESGAAAPGHVPRCFVPPEGETDADLCVVLTLEDGREVIVFLYEQ